MMAGSPPPRPGLKEYRKAEKLLGRAIKAEDWALAQKAYDLLEANNDAYEAWEQAIEY